MKTAEEQREYNRENMRKWRAANVEKSRAAARRYWLENPERFRKASKKYRLKNRKKVMAQLASWRERNKEYLREYGKRRYLEQRDTILNRHHKFKGIPAPTRPRPETCECCGGPPGKRSLHVDHCHETGKFRGWLCYKCNAALGGLGDNLAGVQKAIEYLRNYA